jgi:hypothetical protein
VTDPTELLSSSLDELPESLSSSLPPPPPEK